jgi:hypothetical protein
MNTFITVTAIEWEVENSEVVSERSLVILNVDHIISISAINHDFENGLGIKTKISATNQSYLVAESQEELVEKIFG